MFLVGIFQWWYGAGWLRHAKLSALGIVRTADFFSVDLLAKTLFNPFRQISAERASGSLQVVLQAFFDRLFSRAVGTVVRSLFILFGVVAIVLRCVWVIISITVWSLLPLTPIIGCMLWALGVAW